MLNPGDQLPSLKIIADVCRQGVDPEILPQVVLYDEGTARFSVGVPPPPDDDLPGVAVPFPERVGRQILHTLAEREPMLRRLRSGLLIRIVLEVESGSLFVYLIDDNCYLLGVSPGGAKTDAADRLMAETVNRVRRAMHVARQNAGGFETDDEESAPSDPTQAVRPPAKVFVSEGPSDAWKVTDVCRARLGENRLHYVACFRAGRLLTAVDMLDDSQLGKFFLGTTPTSRRQLYETFGNDMPTIEGRLAPSLRAVTQGGELVRMVLDVERGALYHCRLAGEQYLIGVTLDQDRVAVADREMAALTGELRALMSPEPF